MQQKSNITKTKEKIIRKEKQKKKRKREKRQQLKTQEKPEPKNTKPKHTPTILKYKKSASPTPHLKNTIERQKN